MNTVKDIGALLSTASDDLAKLEGIWIPSDFEPCTRTELSLLVEQIHTIERQLSHFHLLLLYALSLKPQDAPTITKTLSNTCPQPPTQSTSD